MGYVLAFLFGFILGRVDFRPTHPRGYNSRSEVDETIERVIKEEMRRERGEY